LAASDRLQLLVLGFRDLRLWTSYFVAQIVMASSRLFTSLYSFSCASRSVLFHTYDSWRRLRHMHSCCVLKWAYRR